MRKILVLSLIILVLFGCVTVYGETPSAKIAPFISIAHDDGKADSFTSTSADGSISFGSVGYQRQLINIFNVSDIVVPEGYILDSAQLLIYCKTNYEVVATQVGIYELAAAGFDFSSTDITAENLPARGDLITSFDMPGRVNGEAYNNYMSFDLSEYVKACIKNEKRYIALSAFQTTKCGKGGMAISTVYGDYPPVLNLTFRKPQVLIEKYSASIGDTEKNELTAGEITYAVELKNETSSDKYVRLVLAEVSDKHCVNVIISSEAAKINKESSNSDNPLKLKLTAQNLSNKIRMFIVEDSEGFMRPIINEKFEFTAQGWQ